MAWTEERIELLKGMWVEGVSPGLIGKKLRLNTDAVVGKAARLGLEARAPKSKNMFFRSAGGSYREETAAAIAQLTCSQCRWPIGDPVADSGFHFCGAHKNFMSPYCDHHMAIAYNEHARKANI